MAPGQLVTLEEPEPHASPARRVRAVVAALAIAFILVAGLLGYALGLRHAPTEADARVARGSSHAIAEPTAYRTALARARTEAEATGRTAGRRLGATDGRRAGARRRAAVARRRALAAARAAREAAAEVASPCPAGEQLLTQTGTQYCGRPGPARPEDCPAGWEPVGVTGACPPKPDSTPAERCAFSPDLPECLPE